MPRTASVISSGLLSGVGMSGSGTTAVVPESKSSIFPPLSFSFSTESTSVGLNVGLEIVANYEPSQLASADEQSLESGHPFGIPSTTISLKGHSSFLKGLKYGAAYRRSLSQVEQEIKTQFDDAESRIMDVQELTKENMLQLKLVVAESVKQGVFG